MKHFELKEIAETFGVDSPITAAATRYFEYHPSHTFGTAPESEDYWCTDSGGSVWTPPAAISPRIESELFSIHDSFYEVCWNNGEVESVFKDGKLIFSGHDEMDSVWNSLLTVLEYDSPAALSADIEAAYRLGCNPLPVLRKRLESLPIVIQFGIMGSGSGYFAKPRSATLVVELDGETGQANLSMYDYYADNTAWYDIKRHKDVKVKDIL
jgi:hypothetical protein